VLRGIAFAAALSVAAVSAYHFFGSGGPISGKAVLAALQGLEVKHRHEQLATPAVFISRGDTGPVIVIATADVKFPYAWQAATIPSCDGQLCIVADPGTLDIKCEEVSNLSKAVTIVPPVMTFLLTVCHRQ
jgi:hypothetical protein